MESGRVDFCLDILIPNLLSHFNMLNSAWTPFLAKTFAPVELHMSKRSKNVTITVKNTLYNGTLQKAQFNVKKREREKKEKKYATWFGKVYM